MIGKRIQDLIKKKGVQMQDVANGLGVTVQHIYKIFKKESIQSKYIYKFAEILQVSPHVIIDENISVDFSKESTGWVSPSKVENELKDEIKNLEDRIEKLESQIEDKNQIMDFIKKENLFAFGNIINLLLENRKEKDGSILPEQLNDMSRAKIFDEKFVKSIKDAGIIKDEDYAYFLSSIKSKK